MVALWQGEEEYETHGVVPGTEHMPCELQKQWFGEELGSVWIQMVAIRIGTERQVHETLCLNIDWGCAGAKESDDRSPLKRLSAWPCMKLRVPVMTWPDS